MSKQTSYLLGIIATIVLGTLLYMKFCCGCCENEAQKVDSGVALNSVGEALPFSITKDEFNATCEKNFNFLSETFSFVEPVDGCIDENIGKLKIYFDNNPNAKVLLTGYCLSTEKNNSAFPNLGFARANSVKNYLVSKGLSANHFDLNGEVKDAWKIENNTLIGPISYSLTNEVTPAKTEDWSALKTKITASPLVLYFNTNQTEISLTEEQRQQVADIVKYLDHVAEAKVSCVGHTDGTGNRNTNIRLGQERADFAKEYLIKNGIPADKIETSSKGPDEPIADNNSPEGKAKNRRTVVTLK